MCSRQRKKRYSGHKKQHICLRKVAREDFFFFFGLLRRLKMIATINSFLLFLERRRNERTSFSFFHFTFAPTNRREFKHTVQHKLFNFLLVEGTHFKDNEEEATTTTTTTCRLSLVLLLHELEEWLSGLPLPLPLLPLLLRWVVLNNNNNNFKIKNKR